MTESDTDRQSDTRRFPDDYSILELRMIATKALAEGDDYSRALLREQLVAEELSTGDVKAQDGHFGC